MNEVDHYLGRFIVYDGSWCSLETGVLMNWPLEDVIYILDNKPYLLAARTNINNLNLLHICATQDRADIIPYLILSYGMRFNSRTSNGLTPIELAYEGENVDAYRELRHIAAILIQRWWRKRYSLLVSRVTMQMGQFNI